MTFPLKPETLAKSDIAQLLNRGPWIEEESNYWHMVAVNAMCEV